MRSRGLAANERGQEALQYIGMIVVAAVLVSGVGLKFTAPKLVR